MSASSLSTLWTSTNPLIIVKIHGNIMLSRQTKNTSRIWGKKNYTVRITKNRTNRFCSRFGRISRYRLYSKTPSIRDDVGYISFVFCPNDPSRFDTHRSSPGLFPPPSAFPSTVRIVIVLIILPSITVLVTLTGRITRTTSSIRCACMRVLQSNRYDLTPGTRLKIICPRH